MSVPHEPTSAEFTTETIQLGGLPADLILGDKDRPAAYSHFRFKEDYDVVETASLGAYGNSSAAESLLRDRVSDTFKLGEVMVVVPSIAMHIASVLRHRRRAPIVVHASVTDLPAPTGFEL